MFHWCGNGSGVSTAAAPRSFSILFPVSGKQAAEDAVDGGAVTSSSSSSSSSVDCTLTLGTPYTRHLPSSSSSTRMQRSSAAPSLCLDILSQQGNHQPPLTKAGVAGGGNCSGANLNGDPHLLARRCANCDTTSTPLWRNGPRGPKSLCNACGIRYKKEERRAAASSTVMAVPAVGEGISYAYALGPTQHTWGCYAPSDAVVKSSAISVYAGDVEEPRELYLPWRLNVVPSQFPPVGDMDRLSQYQ